MNRASIVAFLLSKTGGMCPTAVSHARFINHPSSDVTTTGSTKQGWAEMLL